MDYFHKGGGGFRVNPKVLGHFECTNNFGILGRQVFGHFLQTFLEEVRNEAAFFGNVPYYMATVMSKYGCGIEVHSRKI